MGKQKIQKVYPLTPMQEGMLYHAMLDPESSSYFTQLELFIDGEFDLGIFEKSVNKLVRCLYRSMRFVCLSSSKSARSSNSTIACRSARTTWRGFCNCWWTKTVLRISYERTRFIDGEFDLGIFEKSVNQLVRSYDILRTVFVHQQLQKPRQVVLAERQAIVELTVLRISYERTSWFTLFSKIPKSNSPSMNSSNCVK